MTIHAANRGLGSRRSKGVSLIELMIALVIGTLLLIGLVQVFAASRTAYQLSTGLARVQENGRFAVDYLQREMRMVGHVGCVNDQARFLPQNVTTSRPPLTSTFLTEAQQATNDYASLGLAKSPLRFDVGIEGYDAIVDGTSGSTGSGSAITLKAAPTPAGSGGNWSPAMSTTLFSALNTGNGKPVQNSDVVILRYFAPSGAQMTEFLPGNPATLKFKNGPNLLEGDSNPGLFGISDCLNSAVFEATSTDIPKVDPSAEGNMTVKIGGLNQSGLLGNQFFVSGQATIYRAESVVFYVGINPAGNPSLYRARFAVIPGAAGLGAPDKQELVEGIESLQFQFGQDSETQPTLRPTGNIGTSVLASAVQPAGDPQTAWRRVGLVQMGVVARSPDTAAAQARNTAQAGVIKLSALGVVINPPVVNDGRYRSVYEDSIAFRNRLFGN